MAAPLSAAQLAQFERAGVVTVDTGLTPGQVDAAEAAWDWLNPGSDEDPENPAGVSRDRTASPAFLATVAHPFFEAAAKQLLRSDAVQIQEAFPHARLPSEHPPSGEWPPWREVWKGGYHIDVQMTTDDFDATPRREQLVFWLWLTEVTEDSGAM